MAGVNKAIVLGNLGRDPELRYTQGGQPVCKLNVATTRVWMNKQTNEKQEETEWHRITVWGKQAEHCNNFLSKGRQVYVEGRIRTSSYEQNGEKRYSTEIVADAVQFIGGRGDSGQQGQNNQGQDDSRSNNNYESGNSGNNTYDDDDIPF